MVAVKILNNIPYVSASRIKMFEKCKYQFFKQYIEPYMNGETVDELKEAEVETEDKLHFTFGTVIHGAIEDFWASKVKKKSTLLQAYEDRCVKHGLADQYYFELGYELLRDYFSYLKNDAPKRKHIASELEFDFMLGDARMFGRIDDIYYRGNGVYEIVDYKTNNWQPPQDEVDSDIQLGIYDIALREDENLKKYWVDGKKPKAVLLTLHFLRHQPMHTEYTHEEREMNKKYIQIIHKQMQMFTAEQFLASLNKFCTYCDFSSECPAYQDALKNDSMDFIDEFNIDEFSDRILLQDELKARIKILSEELDYVSEDMLETFKHSLDADESIVVGDREYYLQQSGKRYVNKSKAIEILKKAGLWKPEEFITSLSISKVQKLTEERDDVWFKIERKAMGYSASSPSLKSKKIKR